MTSPTDLHAQLDWLFAQKPRGRTFGIDRMRAFAQALGHPERALPCVHIAGTNGKGSVAAMLESIFRASGFRVGLYTSPHLVHVGERVQVDRIPLSNPQVVSYVEELRPIAERIAAGDADLTPSFFEYMTAMAFLEFARQKCDLAVIEVGLGGRLDATNVVAPQLSVITSIGLDHCELLGDTIEQIATEKAGIIKPGVPVVVGRVPRIARSVIGDIASERGAPVDWVEDHFGQGREQLPSTNLEGEYQRWNAATATLAARVMAIAPRAIAAVPSPPTARLARGSSNPIPGAAIDTGLRNVDWPGRWERRQIGDTILILDASHNPEGAETLDANLRALVAEQRCKPIVVVGVLGARRAQPLLETIARHAAEIHLVVLNDPRACSFAEMRSMIPNEFAGEIVDDTLERLFPGSDGAATPSSPLQQTVVVTGSIYLVGEVMKRLG